MNLPFPKDLWGDYQIETWTRQQREWFEIWLMGIAFSLLFADQLVGDRVTKKVQEVINLAKANEITAEDAISLVRPKQIFSVEELEVIENNAEKFGTKLGMFRINAKMVN